MAISYRTKVEMTPASEVIWIREDEDGDGSQQHELASFLRGDVPYRAYRHYESPHSVSTPVMTRSSLTTKQQDVKSAQYGMILQSRRGERSRYNGLLHCDSESRKGSWRSGDTLTKGVCK
jgi:hypothetical protein